LQVRVKYKDVIELRQKGAFNYQFSVA